MRELKSGPLEAAHGEHMGNYGGVLQSAFTVVAPVRRDRMGELEAVLDKIAVDPAGNDILPLGQVAGLHYSSLVLFPARADREPMLVFESNVDGTFVEHLERVTSTCGRGIDEVWGACVGYPDAGVADHAAVAGWFRERVVLPGAYHVGATGRSCAQIQAEAELRAEIERYIDEQQAANSLPTTATAIRDAVKAHLGKQPQFAWALEATAKEKAGQRIRRIVHIFRSSDRTLLKPVGAGAAVFGLACWRRPGAAVLALLAGAGGAAVWLRRTEQRDPIEDAPVPDVLFDGFERVEDRGAATNHLASLVDLRPGLGRRTLLRAVLLVIDIAARIRYTKGELGGIPSIHFAHWSIIDRGRRLLFVSNFDGSWESYLDDFIEKAAAGLTAVWSNTANFPRCQWLGIPKNSGGARHGLPFKRIARNSQSPTTIHFSAYPSLSVSNIQSNSAIRAGLVGNFDEEAAQAWLSKL